MDKKFLLASLFSLGAICPVFADTPEELTTFPNASNGEYMKANKVYKGAAVKDNMAGVYENNSTVHAVAQYRSATYNVDSGYYLPEGSEIQMACPADSYCPGGSFGYDSLNAQGAYPCPYGFSSDSGTSGIDRCYTTCDSTSIAHGATVSGTNYYGTNTCTLTACEDGWHTISASNTGVSSTALKNSIGSISGTGWAWVNDRGEWNEGNSGNKGIGYYSLYKVYSGFWAVDYNSQGIVNGMARLSDVKKDTQAGATSSELGATNTGQYCYCTVTGYRPYSANGEPWQKLANAPWIYAGDNAAGNGICAQRCATYMKDLPQQHTLGDGTFRDAMLYYFSASTPKQCIANTINVVWTGATDSAINANNAGTVIYGGDVRTPVEAKPIAGKIFLGWQFSKTKDPEPGE